DADLAVDTSGDDLFAVDEALTRLEAVDPRAARLVELRFFLGVTLAEAAAHLGLQERTAYPDWAYARAWLRQALDEAREPIIFHARPEFRVRSRPRISHELLRRDSPVRDASMSEPASEKSIFLHAAVLDSPAARAAYLEGACGHEPAVRARIESLLAAHDRL